MSKGVVFVDIDGCLLSEDGGVDAEYYRSYDWIAKYIRRANTGELPEIRLCTARNIPFVEAVIKFIGKPYCSYVVVENGVAVYDPTKRENPIFVPQVTEEMKRMFEKIGRYIPKILGSYPGLFPFPGNTLGVTLFRRANSRLDIGAAARFIDRALFNKFFLTNLKIVGEFVAKTFYEKLLFFRKNRRNKIAHKEAIMAYRSLVRVTYTSDTIFIKPPHINKGTAVDFLREKEDLDLSASIGIGDTKIDIPFLEKTRYVGCPDNADEACKEFVRKKGGRVSHHCYSAAVVDILEWYLKV